MAKTSWLQVTGQNPRPFKTKKAAGEALAAELEYLTADGWEKAWGTLGSACLVLRRSDTLTALVVSTVDAEGYDLDPLFSWRCIRPELQQEKSPLSRAFSESG